MKLWSRRTGKLVSDDFRHSLMATGYGNDQRWDVVRFSPDSRYMVVGSNKSEILVWNVASRTEVANPSLHTSNIYEIVFSPDGTLMASASKDSTVRIWSTLDFSLEGVIQGHGRPVYAVSYASDSSQLVTSGKDDMVRVWSRRFSNYKPQTIARSAAGPFWHGRFNSTCTQFTGANNSGEMVFGSIGKSDVYLPFHLAEQPEAMFSSDGRLVAFFGKRLVGYPEPLDQNPVVITDIDGDGDDDQLSAFADWRHLAWREFDQESQTHLAPRLLTRKDHTWIDRHTLGRWTGSAKTSILKCQPDRDHISFVHPPEWNTDRHMTKLTLPRPTHVKQHDFDSDGDLDLLPVSYGSASLAWVEHEVGHRFTRTHLINDNVPEVYAVAIIDANNDGIHDIVALSTSEEGSLFLLEGRSGLQFAPPTTLLRGMKGDWILDVTDVDGDDINDLVCGSNDRFFWLQGLGDQLDDQPQPLAEFDVAWAKKPPSNVLIWDVEKNKLVSHFSALAQNVWTLAISPDGKTVVTGDQAANTLRFWDIESGQQTAQVAPINDTGSVMHSTFSHDGKLLVAAAGDNVYVIDVESTTVRQKLTGHDNTVEYIAVSSDNKYVATTSHDYSVRVWDLDEGRLVYSLIGHTQRPVRCHFCDDGKTLATGGREGEVILWDLVTGQQLTTLRDFVCRRLVDIRFRDDTALFVLGASVGELSKVSATLIGTWEIKRDR